MPCGNVANSITSKLLPVIFLHKDTYFLCCILCEEKYGTVIQHLKIVLAIGSGLEESRLSKIDS